MGDFVKYEGLPEELAERLRMYDAMLSECEVSIALSSVAMIFSLIAMSMVFFGGE